MARYPDIPNLFGTGQRGYGTTWSYGAGEDVWRPRHERESEQERTSYAGRGPKNYQRSDERIREDVCMRLADHPEIDASEIEVTVDNGEVTLSGSVDQRSTKRLAEDVADSVSGVRDVHNQLRVTPLLTK